MSEIKKELFYNAVLPLSQIETDPDNPRKLAISLEDIRDGFSHNDPDYAKKDEELHKLRSVASTIKKSGVLNPIIVVRHGEKYRIVAGERRFLSSFIAGEDEIAARVYLEHPTGFDLRLAQWVENTSREDLTLMERLGNVQDMINAYCQQNPSANITATWLKDQTGLSLPQSTYYINVLKASSDVTEAIKSGYINSLDKAAVITSIEKENFRTKAINLCKSGASLRALRNIALQAKNNAISNSPANNHISLGMVKNPQVITTLINAVMALPEYAEFNSDFADLQFINNKQASKAFKKLINILETKYY